MDKFRGVFLNFILLILLAVLILKVTGQLLTGTHKTLTKYVEKVDFLPFYTGAYMLKNNVRSDFYDIKTQYTWQAKIAPIKTQKKLQPFFNLPFLALLFMPLLTFPFPVAYSLWMVINSFLLFLFCIVSLPLLSSLPLYKRAFVIISYVVVVPTLASLMLGQLGILQNLLVLFAFYFFRKGWHFRSGLLLALLVLKPHFIILPLLALAVQKRFKMLLGVVIGGCIIGFVSLFLVGWQGMLGYVSLLASAMGWNLEYGIGGTVQHSLQTVLLYVLHASTPTAIRVPWIILVSLFSLAVLWVWRRRYTAFSPEFALQWALLVIAMLLVSPHTHIHDLPLLFVANNLLVYAAGKYKSVLRKRILTFLSVGIYAAFAGFFLAEANILSQQPGIVGGVIIYTFVAIVLMRMLIRTSPSLP